jgi:hypothetical protein
MGATQLSGDILWSGLFGKYREKSAFFAYFRSKVSLQLRLSGGGRSHERTLLRLNSLC